MTPFDLTGKTIIVTGGAGHLGRHICAGLANAGAHVICLSSKAFVPPEYSSADVESIICDVQDEDEFAACLPHNIHGLVNCAMRAPRRPDLDMSREDFNAGLDSVITHYFRCSCIATRNMLRGSIVNLASMWGLRAPDLRTYLDLGNEPSFAMAAGAGAILGLSRYMAVSLASRGIRVNCVVPGWFPKKRGPERLDYLAEIEKRVPMGRIGRPDEVAGAVVFLMSDASSYMTGQELIIDGGYTIQ